MWIHGVKFHAESVEVQLNLTIMRRAGIEDFSYPFRSASPNIIASLTEDPTAVSDRDRLLENVHPAQSINVIKLVGGPRGSMLGYPAASGEPKTLIREGERVLRQPDPQRVIIMGTSGVVREQRQSRALAFECCSTPMV